MKYTLLYLPADKPRTDGCILLAPLGTYFTYESGKLYAEEFLSSCKVAEPFLVTWEYNQMKVIGRPSPGVLSWMKVGESVKAVDCKHMPMSEYDLGGPLMIHAKCPTCGHLH